VVGKKLDTSERRLAEAKGFLKDHRDARSGSRRFLPSPVVLEAILELSVTLPERARLGLGRMGSGHALER
jgi:hypothetical protein